MRDVFRLLSFGRAYPQAWLNISLLTLAASGLAALQPWPMKLLVDSVLGTAPLPRVLSRLLPRPQENAAVLIALIVLAGLVLFAANSVIDAMLAWKWTLNGRLVVNDLAQKCFAALQRRSLQYHKRHQVADLMSRTTTDSWSAYQVLDSVLFGPAHALLTSVLMMVLMAGLDFRLAVITLLLSPLMVVASFWLGKPLRAAARLKREIEARLQAHVQQTLTGIPVVQAFGQEEHESLRFHSFASAAIRSQQRAALLGSMNSLSSGLVTTLGSGVVLWLGARDVLSGTLTIGGILVFLVYLGSLQAQIKVLAGVYAAAQNLSASARRVLDVLEPDPEICDPPHAQSLPALSGRVNFENVTTGYEPGQPVLRHISLQADPGKTIAIVGATGAGKSTLVNLIPRLVEPWQGRVLIDGVDIRRVSLKTLRRQIALVLQEPFILPLSIAENIAYGKPEASRDEIKAAAAAAHADEFIDGLPEGYDTVVGERGATLSGGQRQRLGLARAIIRNAPILILDEPTSAVDVEIESLILKGLKELVTGRTTFIIAHRLSTIRAADRIILLKEGQIVESGTHEELMRAAGEYARLQALQAPGSARPNGYWRT